MTNPGGYIVETLQVVFQSFFESSTFEKNLVDVVNRGGDADTSGAIAGMLAGAYYGLDNIPERWKKAIKRDVMAKCLDQSVKLVRLSIDSQQDCNYIVQTKGE